MWTYLTRLTTQQSYLIQGKVHFIWQGGGWRYWNLKPEILAAPPSLTVQFFRSPPPFPSCWFWSIQIFGEPPPSPTIFSEPPIQVSKNFGAPPQNLQPPHCHNYYMNFPQLGKKCNSEFWLFHTIVQITTSVNHQKHFTVTMWVFDISQLRPTLTRKVKVKQGNSNFTTNLSWICCFINQLIIKYTCTFSPWACKEFLFSTLPPKAGGGGGCLLCLEEFSFLLSAN